MPTIIDLTLPFGEDTVGPPSVGAGVKLTSHHRGPGFWQASGIEMLLHTGSHVDFSRHCHPDGETAADVALDRACGQALVIDATEVGENQPIPLDLVKLRGAGLASGEIALIRTDWSDRMWGSFPDYYLRSPYCPPETARWLVDRGVKAVGFDCFSEYAARLVDFGSEDFVVHKTVLEAGAILMQQLTGLSQLPTEEKFLFFAPSLKVRGGEGAPARFFAIIESNNK